MPISRIQYNQIGCWRTEPKVVEGLGWNVDYAKVEAASIQQIKA